MAKRKSKAEYQDERRHQAQGLEVVVDVLQGKRAPPYSKQAEQNVLATMMYAGAAGAIGMDRLQATDFYQLDHQAIFRGIAAMVMAGQTDRNIIGLVQTMKKLGTLEDAGGDEAVGWIIHDCADVTKFAGCVDKILEDRTAREAHAVGVQLLADVHFGGKTPIVAVEDAARGLYDAAAKAGDQAAEPDLDAIFRQAQRSAGGEDLRLVLPFGIENIDEVMDGGAPRRGFGIIAGRPSAGKSTLLRMLALASARAGHRVWFGTCEMGRDEILGTLLSAIASFDYRQIKTRKFHDPGRGVPQSLIDARSELDRLEKSGNLIIEMTPGLRLSRVLSAVNRHSITRPIDLVCIDYLQLMLPETDEGTRDQDIGKITTGLKQLATSRNAAVVAASQFNRANEKEGREPQLSDFRESGSIENDADWAIGLYTDKDNHDRAKIMKQRGGVTTVAFANLHLKFERRFLRMSAGEQPVAPKDLINGAESVRPAMTREDYQGMQWGQNG